MWTVKSILKEFTNSGYTLKSQESIIESKLTKSLSLLYNGKSLGDSFCSSEEYRGMLSISQSNAGVILCKKSMEGLVYPNHKEGQLLIFVDNPRLEFTRLAKRITRALPKVGISESSAYSRFS